MTNHVHVLATPQRPDAVPRMMQGIGRPYVRYVNRRHQRTGTLWEGRYRASLVESERYLLACHRYIEQNPWPRIRGTIAGRVITPTLTARAYVAGAYPVYQRPGSFGEERRIAYRELFGNALDTDVLYEIRESTHQGVVSGSSRSRDEIEKVLNIRATPTRPGRPRKTGDRF